MKVRPSTIEVNLEQRRAIELHLGIDGRATREDVRDWADALVMNTLQDLVAEREAHLRWLEENPEAED